MLFTVHRLDRLKVLSFAVFRFYKKNIFLNIANTKDFTELIFIGLIITDTDNKTTYHYY